MPQRVPGHALVEHLEADAVVQVFAGMDFEAQIHVLLVAGIQHRQPAPRQFVERGLDQSLRPLRKREQVGPGEGARERAHLGQAQPARCARRQQQVAPGPFGARRRIASDRRRREGVEHRVVGRMHGQQLAEDMRGQFADDQAVAGQHAGDLVAIVLAGRGQFHVEKRWSQAGTCRALKPRPAAHSATAGRLLNGASAPLNCARWMLGPLRVCMMNLPSACRLPARPNCLSNDKE